MWLSGIVCTLLFLILDKFMWLRSHGIVCQSRFVIEYFNLIWFERCAMLLHFKKKKLIHGFILILLVMKLNLFSCIKWIAVIVKGITCLAMKLPKKPCLCFTVPILNIGMADIFQLIPQREPYWSWRYVPYHYFPFHLTSILTIVDDWKIIFWGLGILGATRKTFPTQWILKTMINIAWYPWIIHEILNYSE